MNVKITPSKLIGRVNAPSSKSFSHRMIIAAALADGISEISNINPSADIDATCNAMTALGAKILSDGSTYTIKGIGTPSQTASGLLYLLPPHSAANPNFSDTASCLHAP